MIPFAIYTAEGNELTNGVSSERDALKFAQEFANERGELVDVFQGSRKVAIVKPNGEIYRPKLWRWNQSGAGAVHVSDGVEGYWCDAEGVDAATALAAFLRTADYDCPCGSRLIVTATILRGKFEGDVAFREVCS